MTKLYRAWTEIAYGFLFLFLNLDLGTINILPDWVGYYLFFRALPVMEEENREAGLLVWPVKLLGCWALLRWVLQVFGVGWELRILSLVMAVLSLYVRFQFLTNLAGIAEAHGCPNHERLLQLRTVITLLLTLSTLSVEWLRPYLTAASLIVTAWTCWLLFTMRRFL